MVYLVTHKPARSQFRSPRRARPTGLTVMHTAENVLDTVGPDTGAENVADFIRRRTTPGSYHDLVDSDSTVQLVRYGDEAYQDGTGSNPYAMSISFALRTTDWRRLSAARRAAFLAQGAKAFARQQAWLKANGYPTTPLRRVTRTQSENGQPGFISHAQRDPARRTDPGEDFPWTEWFAACRAATGTGAVTTTLEEDPLAPYTEKDLQKAAAAGVLGAQIGRAEIAPGKPLTVGIALDRIYGAAGASAAREAALLAAVRELATARGVDADQVAQRIDAAVDRALADLSITLTTSKGA